MFVLISLWQMYYNLPMLFQLIPPAYAATAWSDECTGTILNKNTNLVINTDVATIQGITCIIRNLLQQIPPALTLVAVFMVIFAGVRLIGAGSDPKAYAAAWATFTYAIVGLVLMAVVWLVLVAIQNFTGAQVTQFGFPN